MNHSPSKKSPDHLIQTTVDEPTEPQDSHQNQDNHQDEAGLPMSVVCYKLMAAGWE